MSLALVLSKKGSRLVAGLFSNPSLRRLPVRRACRERGVEEGSILAKCAVHKVKAPQKTQGVRTCLRTPAIGPSSYAPKIQARLFRDGLFYGLREDWTQHASPPRGKARLTGHSSGLRQTESKRRLPETCQLVYATNQLSRFVCRPPCPCCQKG